MDRTHSRRPEEEPVDMPARALLSRSHMPGTINNHFHINPEGMTMNFVHRCLPFSNATDQAKKSLVEEVCQFIVHPRLLVLAFAVILAGCATEPVTRVLLVDTYDIVAADDNERKQEKSNVIIEDQGEVEDLIQPVRVQDCIGAHYLYEETEYRDRNGQIRIRRTPVMVDVDPLQGVYVRRLRVTNNTSNVLRLNRADAVMVDAAGNDNEMADFQILAQNIKASLPCPSGDAVARTLRPLKILGADVRIRPGRETTFYAMFLNVDKSIVGDWVLELNDFPVETNQVGDVSRVEAFKFLLVSKGFRTEITQQRANLFYPWTEIERTTVEILQ